MKLARSIFCWKAEYKSDAYTDQLGIPQHGYVVEKEIPVTVTDTKQVRGMFGTEMYTGIKAVSEDGQEFTRHWNSFPDDAMDPNYYWDCVEEKNGKLWQPEDAVKAYNHGIPHVRDGKRAIPNGMCICDVHKNYDKSGYGYYKDAELECFWCYAEKQLGREIKDHRS